MKFSATSNDSFYWRGVWFLSRKRYRSDCKALVELDDLEKEYFAFPWHSLLFFQFSSVCPSIYLSHIPCPPPPPIFSLLHASYSWSESWTVWRHQPFLHLSLLFHTVPTARILPSHNFNFSQFTHPVLGSLSSFISFHFEISKHNLGFETWHF